MALTLFATRGYALTSLQEIATALDVTKAALYFYFPAKALLLQSLAGQVRVAAAVGALLGPLVVLNTSALSALHDTLITAALAPLSTE